MRADPPGTAGLPGHFQGMKTPKQTNKIAKLRDRFNEEMDVTSIRSLAKSTRSLTSANLHVARSKSSATASQPSHATASIIPGSVTYISKQSRPTSRASGSRYSVRRESQPPVETLTNASRNDRVSISSSGSRVNRANVHRARIL